MVDFAFVASWSFLLDSERINIGNSNRDFIVNFLHNYSNKRWW
tara:strand:- start:1 stop:129 length:129 start_codon:yes stop_codon:yes gene_type:complete